MCASTLNPKKNAYESTVSLSSHPLSNTEEEQLQSISSRKRSFQSPTPSFLPSATNRIPFPHCPIKGACERFLIVKNEDVRHEILRVKGSSQNDKGFLCSEVISFLMQCATKRSMLPRSSLSTQFGTRVSFDGNPNCWGCGGSAFLPTITLVLLTLPSSD